MTDILSKPAIRLVKSPGAHPPAVAFACPHCGVVFKTEAEAERCYRCKCSTCGVPTRRENGGECDACKGERYSRQRAVARRRDLRDIERVLELADAYGQTLCHDSERFFEADDVDPDDDYYPDWAHATKTEAKMPRIWANDVIERLLGDELGDDCFDSVVAHFDMDGLQAALDAWQTAQRYEVYFEDPTTLVVIRGSVDELRAEVSKAKTEAAE